MYVVIPYISMIYLSGALPYAYIWARTRSTAMRPGWKAWIRGQEYISCCTWHINERNCKTKDKEERLRQRREYERA